MISQARKIAFDRRFPKTEKRVENTTRSGVFLTNVDVLGNEIKHCLECLISMATILSLKLSIKSRGITKKASGPKILEKNWQIGSRSLKGGDEEQTMPCSYPPSV